MRCSISNSTGSVNPRSTGSIPPGLVGDRYIVNIQLEGRRGKGLLDLGSQVTCVTKTYHQQHLTHRPILPVDDLKVLGAGGVEVPHVGYTQVDIGVTEAEAGVEDVVPTLAVVTPTPQDPDIDIIIGTNSPIMHRLVQKCRNKAGFDFLKTLHMSTAWAAAYHAFEMDNGDDLAFNFGDSPISIEWRERFIRLLRGKSHVFSKSDMDIGCTTKVKHRICLKDDTPFREGRRRVAPNDLEDVKSHIRDLLSQNIIRESESPYSSAIVVVRKKTGDVRLCIDYRRLNLRTKRDQYVTPKIEDALHALNGAHWFSCLDLRSGYYQIELEESDKEKTAFWSPLGLFEFNRMPQGICNAPATFQRLMEKCLGDLDVLIYLDDLLIYSDTLEEHEQKLREVLNRLAEYGLKLSPDKCMFAQSSVKCLGHIVSAKGIQPDHDKLSAVSTWPQPTNAKELKSFLGFTGYYRRFIEHYSRIAKPLNDLMKQYEPVRKRGRGKKRKINVKNHGRPNPNTPFGDKWTPACEKAFNSLIMALTSVPVLAYADFNLPFVLHTDASTQGLGAALCQEKDGKLHPVAYASRGLSKSETNYPAHKLEFLALKWAVTEKFAYYLSGSKFTVMTDNNPLTYVLSKAKLDATGHRWLAALANFHFDIHYRPGRSNIDADSFHGDHIKPSLQMTTKLKKLQ